MAGGTAEQQRAASYYLDPVMFAKRIMGDDPWATQIEVARALEKPNARVAVKGCHASSKTYGAAELVLWFITRFKDGIAVTTAPTNRQVEDIMWGEIHKAKARSKFPYPPGNLTELNLGTKAIPNFATGFTTDKSDQAAKMSGYHGPHIFFVLDEAPGIPPEILEAIEGAAAGGDVRVLMLGNPTIPGGPFHDAFTSNRETWKTFTIDAYDTPNFAKLRVMADGKLETITALLRSLPEGHPAMCYQPRPYFATPLWARARLKEWGENSPRWQARVRGQFPLQAEDALISLLWLEQAEKREARPAGGRLWAGIDVAGPSEDETVAYVRDGAHVLGFGAWSSADPRGEVVAFLNPFKQRLETSTSTRLVLATILDCISTIRASRSS
jgi:phage terminase large subunit